MRVRSVRPDDFAAEKRLLGRLSARTAYMRFHKNGTDVTDDEIIDFTQIDHDREAARVVVDNSNVGPEMHGVGRIFIAPGSKTAEFGILIEDDYQRAGLGSILMQQLEDEARRRAQKLEDEERRRAQKLEDEARRKAEREKEKKEAEEKRKAERIRSKIETQLISAGGQMLKRGLLGILKK